jgi:peptidoglycan/LPS O-acetylase OafA/YrhL
MGDQISRSTLAWIQNLTLTQWLSLIRHPTTSAFENQSLFIAGYWSLNYEEQFYIVIGLLLLAASYFSQELMPFILMLMVPAFVWNVLHPSICYGFFLEYYFSFALGAVVFYRLCRITNSRIGTLIDVSLVCLLLFAILKNYARATHFRSVYFEWIIAIAFSIALLSARRWDARFAASSLGKCLRAFGLISYSLYLTQQCNLRASQMVANRLVRWGFPSIVEFPVRLIFICVVGAVFWYFCERPFLNKHFSATRTRAVLKPASV